MNRQGTGTLWPAEDQPVRKRVIEQRRAAPLNESIAIAVLKLHFSSACFHLRKF
jgi:hypothetical protein